MTPFDICNKCGGLFHNIKRSERCKKCLENRDSEETEEYVSYQKVSGKKKLRKTSGVSVMLDGKQKSLLKY